MNKLKSENSNKLITSKFLYALSLIGVGLCFTSQTANAMFKSSLDFFRKLESLSSRNLNSNTKPLTSSTSTVRRTSISSRSSKLSVQTSSLGTKPENSSSTSTYTPSSFADKLKFFSSLSTQSTSSDAKTKPKTPLSTNTQPVSSTSETKLKTSEPTNIKPLSLTLENKSKIYSSTITQTYSNSRSTSKLLILNLGDQLEAKIELPSSSSSKTKPSSLISTKHISLVSGTKPKTSSTNNKTSYLGSVTSSEESKSKSQKSFEHSKTDHSSYSDPFNNLASKKLSPPKSSLPSLGNSIKGLVGISLFDELSNKKIFLNDNNPNEDTLLNDLRVKVYSLSVQAFNTKARKQLSSKNIPINSETRKAINRSAGFFSMSIVNLVTDNFKQGVEKFNNIMTNKNFDSDSPEEVILRISNNYSKNLDILINEHMNNSLHTFMKLHE